MAGNRAEKALAVLRRAMETAPMQDGYLARFVATGAAIGAMAGALFGVSPMGPVWGLVIGTLGVFLWAWNRRFPGDPELAPVTVLASEGQDAGSEDALAGADSR